MCRQALTMLRGRTLRVAWVGWTSCVRTLHRVKKMQSYLSRGKKQRILIEWMIAAGAQCQARMLLERAVRRLRLWQLARAVGGWSRSWSLPYWMFR